MFSFRLGTRLLPTPPFWPTKDATNIDVPLSSGGSPFMRSGPLSGNPHNVYYISNYIRVLADNFQINPLTYSVLCDLHHNMFLNLFLNLILLIIFLF